MKFYPIFHSCVPAQALAFALALQLTASSLAAQTLPTALNIVVVQGDGATGRVRHRVAQAPVIRVLDEHEKPIAGAAVVFTLPTEGATGVFGNGDRTLTIMTDERGAAAALGLRFNHIPGKVPVHVNVSYRGLTARANIMQISEAPAGYKPGGGSAGKIVAILAVLAAGGAGGAYYALRNSSSSAPTPAASAPAAIGITPGNGSLAPPR